MIRRPPGSTQSRSSAASDVYKRQQQNSPHQPSSRHPRSFLCMHTVVERTNVCPCARYLIFTEGSGSGLSIIISAPHALAGRHWEPDCGNLSTHSFPSHIREIVCRSLPAGSRAGLGSLGWDSGGGVCGDARPMVSRAAGERGRILWREFCFVRPFPAAGCVLGVRADGMRRTGFIGMARIDARDA